MDAPFGLSQVTRWGKSVLDEISKNLDTTISELGKVVLGLIDVIPGARRMLRRTDPPTE